MEILQLETFLAVATYGGFHRAAEALRISQPAVSARISALEVELGAKLFERDRRKFSLSLAGRALRPLAEQLLRQVQHGEERGLGAGVARHQLADARQVFGRERQAHAAPSLRRVRG